MNNQKFLPKFSFLLLFLNQIKEGLPNTFRECIIYLSLHIFSQAVSQKDAPLNNFFLFNGINDEGMVDKISL